ncbi:MAG: DUF2007 domain-containing protein [Dehalococcoidales bacterium]|nr:DUF2007 domain-containing protein [Dehalococcoidales bacterium]
MLNELYKQFDTGLTGLLLGLNGNGKTAQLSNDKQKLVEVYRATGEIEAQVIRSLLEQYGVPCLLKSNAAPSAHMFAINGMGEVRVMVWEEIAEKARTLIRSKDDA